MYRLPHVDTILWGAGLSKPGPTHAPDGDELAEVALRALIQSVSWNGTELQSEALSRMKTSDLRLEKLMQIWWDATHDSALFAAYEALGALVPNANHRLLATRTSASLVTLNMDTCVEDAARAEGAPPVNVIHLHGTWDNLDSIKTTIASYEAGLSPLMREVLRPLYMGKSVLVAGYSGRDHDVLPLFLDYPPQVIHWVQHDPNEDRSLELASFLDRATDLGIKVVFHYGSATPLLRSVPGAIIGDAEGRMLSARVPDEGVSQALQLVSESTRRIALALTIADLGMWDEAISMVDQIPQDDPTSIYARKLAGRFHRQAGRPGNALTAFGWPPGTLGGVHLVVSSANELLAAGLEDHRPMFVLANAIAAAIPGRLLPSGRPRRTGRAARTRTAQYLSMRGLAPVAEMIATRGLSAAGPASFGMRLNEEVYLSDAQKAQGRYVEALERLRSIERWYPYLGIHGQSDFRWRMGELLLLTGEANEARRHVDWLVKAAPISGSTEQLSWQLTTCIAVLAETDPDLTDILAGRLEASKGVSVAARSYSLFGLAELALWRGDAWRAGRALEEAGMLLEGTGWLYRLPTYRLTLHLMRTRILALNDPERATQGLNLLQRRFRHWRMASLAMRCAVLSHNLGGPRPSSRSIQAANENRWDAELRLFNSEGAPPFLPVVL